METIKQAEELYNLSKRLINGADHLVKHASEKAEAEMEYRKELQKSIVRLKDEGQSVTLIGDISRGECAELKYQRDVAEAKYNAARDALRALIEAKSGLQTVLKYYWEVEE